MTEKAGKNRSDYKRVNRGLVLRMIATGECATRSDLVRSTGLSKMAISNIVAEMLQIDVRKLHEPDDPSGASVRISRS